jgi:hypothetical protein
MDNELAVDMINQGVKHLQIAFLTCREENMCSTNTDIRPTKDYCLAVTASMSLYLFHH